MCLLEKNVPCEHKYENLAAKSDEFLDLYKSVCPDPTARAKVPILEVGARGADDYFAMIESGAVSEYIASAYAGEGSPLKPTSARDETCMRLFMQVYAEGIQAADAKMMMAKCEADVVQAFEKLCVGMISANNCLEKHGREGSGSFFLGEDFTLAETFTAPFIARSVMKLQALRGVSLEDIAADMDLQRFLRWIKAVTSRESVAKTTPSKEFVSKVPPYLAADWFTFQLPVDRQKEISKEALQMDATADEKARMALVNEGAKLVAKM